jgi:hypothetical protein
MNVHSFGNEDEVLAWLSSGIESFDMNSPCGGRRLADAIHENQAKQIQERSLGEQRGAILPFRPNTSKYAQWKLDKFGTDLINVQTGGMLSEESIQGELIVNGKELQHVYGTGKPGESKIKLEEPKPKKPGKRRRKARKGKRKEAGERRQPTDREKAAWAAEDGRSFFELDDQIKDRNTELASESLEEHLRNHK